MAELTILGIGNILMRDEGVGVRLMEALRDAQTWPDRVEFIDGGVGGLNLLSIIEEARELIVFDAADMGLEPGQARVIVPEQVAEDDAAGRLSMHELPFIETLRLCEQFSRRPPTTILAIQPELVEHGRELSETMAAAMEGLKRQALAMIESKLVEAHVDERGLAQDIFEQLHQIAVNSGFTWLTHIDLVIGSMHGVTAEMLEEGLENIFEGTQFEGAMVEVKIVEPLEQIKAPGRNDIMTASGWEILVTRLEGRKQKHE